MKKILLLTGALDDEEDVAAQNLGQALKHLASPDSEVEAVNLLNSSYGRFDGVLDRVFLNKLRQNQWRGDRPWRGSSFMGAHGWERLRDGLGDLLRGLEPDVVVYAAPLYGVLLAEIERAGRPRNFSLLALACDPLVDHSSWAQLPADFFVMAGETAARALVAAGVPRRKLKVFGFPVRLSSAEDDQSKEPEAIAVHGSRRILYLINCARKKAPKMLDLLLEQPGWTITACVEDEDLEEMARAKAAAAAPGRLEVLGQMGDLPGLLRSHQVVITRADTGVVQEAIAAGCPVIVPKTGARREETNVAALERAHAGARARKPRAVVAWLKRAFADEGKLLALWRRNLEGLGKGDAALEIARFVLQEAKRIEAPSPLPLRALPAPASNPGQVRENGEAPDLIRPRLRRPSKQLLLCDLHAHTTWSDGKLTMRELVDFYGERGFDCLCVTDHLCDAGRLLGRLVNLTGLVIPPGEVADYFEAVEREKKRARAKYDLILMTGVEFNKDGYTAKTSAHLLGIDLQRPIDPSMAFEELIAAIHAQGGLAVASHPHETKGHWGKDTLYFWEHIERYAPLLDAWEVANRDDIFNPVGLKKLPFIASSDFHKPKHIHSWKTLLYCEKEAEAIKHCIRVNRDVSMTLYRDHRFGLEENRVPLLDSQSREASPLVEQRG